MKKAGKPYTTFYKVRLALFTHTYAYYLVSQYIRNKYKFNETLTVRGLRKFYVSKHAIPEISRLSKVLHLNYQLLWKSIIFDTSLPLSRAIRSRNYINLYLSIEKELIFLSIAKYNASAFKDPDYESESALLSIAIERAVGDALQGIDSDILFEQQLEILKKKYVYWYYKIAYTYKLPTMRIVPFILRLITD